MVDVEETEIGEKKVYFKMKESQYISMRDPKKSLGKNSITQNSMLHLELILPEYHLKKCFFHLHILFFPHVFICNEVGIVD